MTNQKKRSIATRSLGIFDFETTDMPVLRPYLGICSSIVWTACICFVVTIALCVVVSDAFSICSFPPSGGIDSIKIKKEKIKTAKLRQRLYMVAQMPTSNVTLDDIIIAESVVVDKVDVNDAKFIDDDYIGESEDLSTMDTMKIKSRLLNLLSRMTGTPEQYNRVESYVNTLEERYTPVQTLDFLNLAMSGEWQLLFSTNIGGNPLPNFRLRELCQRIESNDLNGTIVNEATWELAEDHKAITPMTSFDAHGTFSIKCSYSINQGARMAVQLNDHIINLGKGSVVPKDVERLVALLYRAIPMELFDPNDHAMDTTYLDGDLRIVRMAGPKFEAVRNIFIRKGSMQTDPLYNSLHD